MKIGQDSTAAPELTIEEIDAQIDRVHDLRLRAFLSQRGSGESRIDGALAFLRTLDRDDLLLLAAEDIMAAAGAIEAALDGPHEGVID